MAYLNPGANIQAVPLPKEAQMSTIEDFEITDNGTLVYVGNYLNYTNELGKSNSNSGGVLRVNNQKEIVAQERLPLPKNLNARRIVYLNNNQFLVLANDDRSFVISIPQK